MFTRALLSILVAVSILGAVAAPAAAAPSVVLDPSTIEVGDTTAIRGSGFEPGTVVVYLGSTSGPPLARSEHRGAFNFRLEVSGLTADTYQILACNNQARNGECREEASAVLSIQPAPPPTSRETTTTTERTTTERPSTSIGPPTTITTSTGRISTSGTPSTAVITTTTAIDDVAVESTPGTVDTPDPSLGISTTIGPEPTFDPNPDGLAVSIPTSGPAFIPPVIETDDLAVVAIEVSQGIQNMSSTMPLVAERTTWVRVHVDNGGDGPWFDVDGLLLLQRPGMDDLQLVPSNGPIQTKLPRTDIDATLNFEIPDAYLDEGDLSIWAGAWSVVPSTIDDEPDPVNNYLHLDVEFHEADTPTIWLVALDDGAGPGPPVTDLLPLLDFAKVIHQDLLDYHPTADVNYHVYPVPLEPGPEAAVPGLWDLDLSADDDDTAGARRHEPNQRMAMVHNDMPEHENMLGRIDSSIPSGGYDGWAGYGVAWTKPIATTPAHEFGHSRGLKHVACKDSDGNGVPDELAGGPLDPVHPMGLPPNCSLAPISPIGYYGLTTEQATLTVYSNDPTDPAAAYPAMSYKEPGWTDPYYWCLLLEEVGVPCSPAAIGVPPKIIQPAADCDPQPSGNGIGMDLCLIDQLPPPSDPLGDDSGDPGAVPWTGTSHYGVQTFCDGALEVYLAGTLNGSDFEEANPQCGVEQAGDGTTEHFFTVEIAEGPIGDEPPSLDIMVPAASLDPDRSADTDWAVVYGYADFASGDVTITHVERRPVISGRLWNQYVSSVSGALSGGSPAEAVLSVGRPSTVRDGATDVFAQVPVEVWPGSGHGGGSAQGATAGFVQAVPIPGSGSYIRIKGLRGDVSEVPISPNAPVVTSVATTDTGDATLIEWSASDPDGGDPPLFDVLWSTPTGGWIHAATAVDGTSLEVPHDARFPGGDVVVKVVANDGVNTGEAQSEPFAAPTHDPLLFATGVPEGGASEQYDTVLLQAHLVDPESSAAAPESVRWSSSIDGDLGSGTLLRTRDLSVGTHTIEVQAADGDGNVAIHSVELDITPRARATRYLEVPDSDAAARLSSAAAGLGAGQGDEGALASARDLPGGLPGGLLGLGALLGGVAVVAGGGGWALSRRRFR